MQSPERDYIIGEEEDEETPEVDQGAARLGDVHHLNVGVGGGAAEEGSHHGGVAVFQGGDPLKKVENQTGKWISSHEIALG